MKKRLPLLIILAVLSLNAFSQQAVAPTLIVFPDNTWMKDHGFMSKIDNDGKMESLPNYDDAFESNRDIGTAIGAIEKVLVERGFQLKSLKTILLKTKEDRAMDLASAAGGSAAEVSPMDELLQQANPDIRVELGYSVEPRGPRKDIQFNLEAKDAYTSEPVATCMGTVEGTMDPTHLALQKIVAGKCDDFCQQLMNYYDDLKENGRKITVSFRSAEGSGIDFMNDEIGDDGDTYSEFLYKWLREHAINKAVKKGQQTKTKCVFDPVRIPFFNEEGDPIEAYDWAVTIRKAFRAETGKKLRNREGNALGRVSFDIGAD